MKNRKKAIIIVLIVLYALVMFHQFRWYKKMRKAEPYEIKVIQDDIFSPLNEKLELIYKIAKPMIQSLKPLFVKSSKEINGKSVTLETFFKLVKKQYNGEWNRANKIIYYKAFDDIFEEILSKGSVVLMNTAMQKELGDNMIEHFSAVCIASEFKSSKIIKIVPIKAYITSDKREIYLDAAICKENDIVIGFFKVSKSSELKTDESLENNTTGFNPV